ncbi:hypothetical protein BDZ89DRAFT_1141714 [Hymenopellis radicata]|nr:hypothetical protein BDZ89DRAFT_1141714 [Hymenopellis radicata]
MSVKPASRTESRTDDEQMIVILCLLYAFADLVSNLVRRRRRNTYTTKDFAMCRRVQDVTTTLAGGFPYAPGLCAGLAWTTSLVGRHTPPRSTLKRFLPPLSSIDLGNMIAGPRCSPAYHHAHVQDASSQTYVEGASVGSALVSQPSNTGLDNADDVVRAE